MADNIPAMNTFRKVGDKYTYNGMEMSKEEFDQKQAEVDQAMQKIAPRPKPGRSAKDRAADAFKDLESMSPTGNKKGGKIMMKADGGEVKNPNEGAPFTIFNRRTGETTGKANTLKGARRSKDRKDNEYGGYAHAIKDSAGNHRHKSGGKISTAQQNPKLKNCW
jgi:hypothetical protein